MSNQENLISINFEVFGHVQGVFFRKYTKKEADKLGLKGWCRNTSNDTVQGVLEGYAGKVEEMKHWLETQGSPSSRIDKTVFENRKDIPALSYKSFDIRR